MACSINWRASCGVWKCRRAVDLLDEFALIRRYFSQHSLSERIALGVGDDCALLSPQAGEQLAVSVDTQVAGVHFHDNSPPFFIATRALACAVSDLAAMGAQPLGFTLALTLPQLDEAWLEDFSRGLYAAAQSYHCPLIGGDTCRGSLTISIQVHGALPAGSALTRAGAGVGDDVWVSGTLGDGAAALAWLEGRFQVEKPVADYLATRFYQPQPELALGVQLRGLASAAIDVSDGLLADLGHLCHASEVGAVILVEQLPLASEWSGLVSQRQARDWALTGGDDYRLCFTAAASARPALLSLAGVSLVGQTVAGSGVHAFTADGQPWSVATHSYRHF